MTTSRTAMKERLKRLEIFSGISQSSLDEILKEGIDVDLEQGQTLIRDGVIETHAFILLEGCVRLLSKDPTIPIKILLSKILTFIELSFP